MTADRHARLQGELDRLTQGNTPADKARFAEAFWRNVRNWDEQFEKDAKAALRELGAAHLARILVTEHLGSPQYAQALRDDFEGRTGKVLGTQRGKVA